MKIAIADNCGGKFSTDIREHWEKLGHEVKFERGASEYLAQWADVYYVDFWDNNIHYLYKLYNGDPDKNRPKEWDNNKKPKIVVRAVDWDVWIGFARDQRIIDWVDEVICIAPHIEKELRKHADFKNKLHLIYPGVNLDKFTLKQNFTNGFQIGMVLGDMWWMKNHMAGLDIFTTLVRDDPRWRLHIRGQHEGGNDYWKTMFDYYLESRGIADKVTLYAPVEDMNVWYEQIDVLLHPGMKEAFCYAVAEALAKGIPVVANRFYGSDDIWDHQGGILYDTHEEAVAMIKDTFREEPIKALRQYVKAHYDIQHMMQKFDNLIKL